MNDSKGSLLDGNLQNSFTSNNTSFTDRMTRMKPIAKHRDDTDESRSSISDYASHKPLGLADLVSHVMTLHG